jgi:hypothetical protein
VAVDSALDEVGALVAEEPEVEVVDEEELLDESLELLTLDRALALVPFEGEVVTMLVVETFTAESLAMSAANAPVVAKLDTPMRPVIRRARRSARDRRAFDAAAAGEIGRSGSLVMATSVRAAPRGKVGTPWVPAEKKSSVAQLSPPNFAAEFLRLARDRRILALGPVGEAQAEHQALTVRRRSRFRSHRSGASPRRRGSAGGSTRTSDPWRSCSPARGETRPRSPAIPTWRATASCRREVVPRAWLFEIA